MSAEAGTAAGGPMSAYDDPNPPGPGERRGSSLRCGRSCSDGSLEERLRRPAHQRNRVVPIEPGDIDHPHQSLDADRGAHGEHELAELGVGEIVAEAVEGFGDPPDRPALAKGQGIWFGVIHLEREAQHGALLRLGVKDHRSEVAHDGVEAFGWGIRCVLSEHRGGPHLRVGGEQQSTLVRKVAVRRRPRGRRRRGGVIDRRRDSAGHQGTSGGDQRRPGTGLLRGAASGLGG